MTCQAIVFGEPVAQGRPRFTRNGRAYDPPKSRAYKKRVREACAKSAPETPVDGAVRLLVAAYFGIPKSWSRRKKWAAFRNEIRPTKRPDLSNVLKGVEDALNGLWYEDDAQIVSITCAAWYSDEPRVEILMKEE